MIVVDMVMRVEGMRRLTLKGKRVRDGSKAGISCPPQFPVGEFHTSLDSLNQINLVSMPVPISIDIGIWSKYGLRWYPRKH